MRYALVAEIRAVLDHGSFAVRCDDAQSDAFRIGDPVQVAMLHRAGMKSGYLIVVDICGDEGLRRKFAFHVLNIALGDAHPFQVGAVRAEIVSHGGHRERVLVQ